MLENKLNVSVVIKDTSIVVFANQLVKGKPVSIFNKKEVLTNFQVAKKFIKDSIEEIEFISEQKIESINLIFDDYSIKQNILKTTTKIIEETIEFKTETIITKSHYIELFNSILKNNQNLKESKLISIIPFKFVFENELLKNKNYSIFPFSQKVKWVKSFFTLSYISRDFYEKVIEIFDFRTISFKNIILLSQISLYKFNGNISDKLTFTLDIQKKQTILSTNVNQVTVAIDRLKYSLDDLINKIKEKFKIDSNEIKNIIYTYNFLNIKNKVDCDEVIFATGENDLQVTNNDINDVIKSFIKTISLAAREIIKVKTNSFSIDFDVNIVGRLEHIKNIDIYCSNHIGIRNVISNKNDQNSFYNWNKTFTIERSLNKFLDIIDLKIKDDIVEKPKQSSLLFFGKKYYSKKKSTHLVLM